MKKALPILVLLLAGCAGGGTREAEPEWLDGSSERYPEVRYLHGQGQGATSALARDHARAELAKVFALRVTERSEDIASAEITEQGGVAQQRSETHAQRSVQTETERVLEGVRIVETWRDPEGVHHAFAVLDRLSEGERLRTAIAGLDQVIDSGMDRARNGKELLPRIGAAAQAVDAQIERDALQQDLRVLDITGVGVPARYERARLEADFAALASRVKLSAEAESDPNGQLASVLQGSVRRAGFVNAGTDADYRLVSSLALDMSSAEGWEWATGTLELRMMDKSGQVVGTERWPIKASARQAAVAHQRALGEVDRLLRARLRDTVISFASGLH